MSIQKRLPMSLAASLFFAATLSVAGAPYSGGTGEADDPYEIATAADLILLGERPDDYDKCFILTADIDLDPNLPGGTVFDRAVVAFDTNDVEPGFQGTAFTGVLDGNGHTISRLRIAGGSHLGLFGHLGSGAKISDLGLEGVDVDGTGDDVGGLVGWSYGSIATSHSTGTVGGVKGVGGLLGCSNGSITTSYSAGTVSGVKGVGGLVGELGSPRVIYRATDLPVPVPVPVPFEVTNCYSTGIVCGGEDVGGLIGTIRIAFILWIPDPVLYEVRNCYSMSAVCGGEDVGGLVGEIDGPWEFYDSIIDPGFFIGSPSPAVNLSHCYSTGSVSGREDMGGLVGAPRPLFGYHVVKIRSCLWDTETSGQMASAGGLGRTTAEMQTASTYLEAGWDFVDESENGKEDTWWILEGQDYPKLTGLPEAPRSQPILAFCPEPCDCAADVQPPPILRWASAEPAFQHDIYFGDDRNAVTNATSESSGVYRGRQPHDVTTYEPGALEYGKTYYWRIDEVNEADPNGPWKGQVWSFTTANFVVVDDFESYDDEDNRLYDTWIDGFVNGTGLAVGWWDRFPESPPGHSSRQGMPFEFCNTAPPYYSEASRTWDLPQDWTAHGMDTLTLYFQGKQDNGPAPLYVGIEDSAGQIAVAVHPAPNAVLADEWMEWNIPFSDLVGVNPAAIMRMYIGVGDRGNPKPGGCGRACIDDIRLTQAPVPPEPSFVVVDDFESYDDEDNRIFDTWIDGWTNGTGSTVGGPFEGPFVYISPPTHSGEYSMPFEYDNTDPPYYSEASRTWESPQDWTAHGSDTVSLWVRGEPVSLWEKPDGTVVMSGYGSHREWRGDDYGFVHRQLTGDGEIVARVDSLSNAEGWDRAGVMIRANSYYDSPYVATAATTAHGVSFAYCLGGDSEGVHTNRPGSQIPHWVKLIRRDNVFTAQHSDDGTTWQNISDAANEPVAVDVVMPETVYIGLCVSGSGAGVWGAGAATAAFSDIAFCGEVTGAWQTAAWSSWWEPTNSPDDLYVALQDNAGRTAVVIHPDPSAVTVVEWQRWRIPFSTIRDAGVDLTTVKTIYVGVGNRDNPTPAGPGMIHIDDIGLTSRRTQIASGLMRAILEDGGR